MNVLVLGASGGVGRHLVRLAAQQGHAVTAVSRSGLDAPPGVRVVVDDVLRAGCLDEAVAGQQAVLSALGIKRVSASPWSALASPRDFSSGTARALVAAMKKHGVGRVVAVSAAGVGVGRPGMNVVMRALLAVSKVGLMYDDLDAMEQVYATSGLDWTCVRPTTLTDGPQTGAVRRIASYPLTASISRADVAAWMVQHLAENPGADRCPIITGP